VTVSCETDADFLPTTKLSLVHGVVLSKKMVLFSVGKLRFPEDTRSQVPNRKESRNGASLARP
jgi:hypothetical protein